MWAGPAQQDMNPGPKGKRSLNRGKGGVHVSLPSLPHAPRPGSPFSCHCEACLALPNRAESLFLLASPALPSLCPSVSLSIGLSVFIVLIFPVCVVVDTDTQGAAAEGGGARARLFRRGNVGPKDHNACPRHTSYRFAPLPEPRNPQFQTRTHGLEGPFHNRPSTSNPKPRTLHSKPKP